MAVTKSIQVGNLVLGGGAPVVIQSMLSRPSTDREGNLEQARRLAAAGCQMIRTAVPDQAAVSLIPALKEATGLPIVADIHFDYRLAIEAAYAGADKIRLNPGNIGSADRVAQVAKVCREKGIPIRVGANAGSLSKEVLARFGGPTPLALAESALEQVALLERWDFDQIVLSVKASHVATMVEACRIIHSRSPYPQHLGVTEAGTPRMGVVKSAIGLGALLLEGIGDTIRVSLTADPVEEVRAAQDILAAVGLLPRPQLVSCPTCGRCRVDLMPLAAQVEELLTRYRRPMTVAVMGCAVNGPGEARQADLGIAGGDGCFLLFQHGEVLRRVPQEGALEALRQELDRLEEAWKREEGVQQ